MSLSRKCYDGIMLTTLWEEQAYQLYTDTKVLLKTGAFNLRKFSTNINSLQARIDSEESAYLGDRLNSNESMETFSQATQLWVIKGRSQ